MNQAASTAFATEFLHGFVEAMGALQAVQADARVEAAGALNAEALRGHVDSFDAVMHADAGGNGIALLLNGVDIAAFASKVNGVPAGSSTLDDNVIASARDIYDACMSGGAARLKEARGLDIPLTAFALERSGPGTADTLLNLLGGDAVVAPFAYTIPGTLDSRGVLLFSADLQIAVKSGGLSQNDINDILNNFGQATAGGRPATPVPGNLDMVLDIRLNAIVRLGHIELPIAEILALGPGSIIEVGHAVNEPIELLVNGKLIARGDVVVVDEKFALRITELISTRERIEVLR